MAVTYTYFGWFLIVCLIVFILFGVLPQILIFIFGGVRYRFKDRFNFLNKGSWRYDSGASREYLIAHVKKHKLEYSFYEPYFKLAGIPLEYDKRGNLIRNGWSLELHRELEGIGRMYGLDKKFKK